MLMLAMCGVLVVLACSDADAAAGPTLAMSDGRIEVGTGNQRVVFVRNGDGHVPMTEVRVGETWRPFFDAERPIVGGPLFDLVAEDFVVTEDTDTRKVVTFAGRHRAPDYPWTMRVEARAGSPLLHFRVTCELSEPLVLDAPQPVVAFWLAQSGVGFHLDQGPDSIYGSAGVPYNFGFPAAYCWDGGREAAIFFNMSPVRWMRPDGVAGFHDVRVMTQSDGEATGLGLHCLRTSGSVLPAGPITIAFHLHQAARAEPPTGLEALDRMIGVFAPLHPRTAVPAWNHDLGKPARWEDIARGALADLTGEAGLVAEFAAPWIDAPLALAPDPETMVVHPGSILADPENAVTHWDYSTVNNHLAPWLLLARLWDDERALDLGRKKLAGLPRFYDPRAGLIRHGTRQPPHVGDLEMSWQNLFFHENTLRAAMVAPPAWRHPAIEGRILMAMSGLRELARRNGDVLPQWFDPYTKEAAVQNDVKALGRVREPWQAGAHALVMMRAHRLTGDDVFRSEAERIVDSLMEGIEYRVVNDVYDRRYSDPAGYPITELFGNAYGIAAAWRLHEATGEDRHLRHARDFLNTLLRLTPWHEDESDAIARELGSAGLFYPHGGAHVVTPWETSEAHLLIAWTLRHDTDHPLEELLLTLTNLNRRNAFHFFPATWSATVRAHDPTTPREGPGNCFPIEPFYSLEGRGGHRGPTAAYMAGLALWNAWLYEALAEADDDEILVLNLDTIEDFEAAIHGVERHFLVHNPTGETRRTAIRFKHLEAGQAYRIEMDGGEVTLAAAELSAGWPIVLEAGAVRRIVLRVEGHAARFAEIERGETAARALADAYRILQELEEASRADGGEGGAIAADRQARFRLAVEAFQAGRSADALSLVPGIIHPEESD